MTSTTSDKRQRIPLEQRPHALYRFYDARRQLLYVGITAALPTRLGNHNDQKPWWTEVVDIKVEHFPDRDSVLAAEKAAIVAERPLHNIQHNRGGAARTSAYVFDVPDALPGEPTWTFYTLRHHHERTRPLWLFWELNGDPVSQDYYVHDISASELWDVWVTRYPRDEQAERLYGPGAVRITWYVEGPGVFEGAPFHRHVSPSPYDEDFLSHFTWPVKANTREPVQWSRLPVIDKVWRADNLPARYEFKGGFVQEATGWKPAPLQPYVNVPQLARMARLYHPEAWQ